jgi:hypothetical protein
MRRTPLILASLAVAVLGSMLLIDGYAQEGPCFPTLITVPQGTCRAALEKSEGDGTWTFTIENVNGKISRVDIQIYESALPTSGMIADVYAVCASIPDPYDRVQETCGLALPEGRVANAGSLSIKRVTPGAKGSITLDGGVYCVRPCVFGNGQVKIFIDHP